MVVGEMSGVKNAISLRIDNKSGILVFKYKTGDGVLLVGDIVVFAFHRWVGRSSFADDVKMWAK